MKTQEHTAPAEMKDGAEDIFSPEELQAVRAFYFQRLTPGEKRILRAFEGPLQEEAPQETRMAAFAELRRSGALRDYIEAQEACRLADKASALGLSISRASSSELGGGA